KKELREKRKEFQMMFQDPYASLNPRMTVGEIIGEPLEIQTKMTTKEREAKVLEIMDLVGLNTQFIRRYPHEFSGGQRQRIGIARAIILQPKLLVCDEPVSALDVSIQAQIINLMEKLQEHMGIAYMFISHDLSVVRHISDKVAVMYLGHIVEFAEKDALYDNPEHPYTIALLSVIPSVDKKKKKEKIILQGDLPSPANPPTGCCFHTRCYKAKDICEKEAPELRDLGNGHLCACHFPGK
ncbi:MAG: ATP-binding cassette domain-containing protein, partial [Eubacterium sp.]